MKTDVMTKRAPRWMLPAGAVGRLFDAQAAFRPHFTKRATVGQPVFSQRALALVGAGFRYHAGHANRGTRQRARQAAGWVTGARL